MLSGPPLGKSPVVGHLVGHSGAVESEGPFFVDGVCVFPPLDYLERGRLEGEGRLAGSVGTWSEANFRDRYLLELAILKVAPGER